ncbi:hypothetical protein COCNU_14G008230 [Cocos nucifera]|uniref:Uncharacterized protein n=1 Tax=Cocos nucifera TaxID=13894 RepID=A0A8K0IVF1_COCNU|nr:hypothetical protein COCNU_14G008230 [Cocos nucifera]
MKVEVEVKAAKAKAKCLREVLEKIKAELNKAKVELTLEKKIHQVAQEKVTELEKKAESQAIKVAQLVVETFWASKEFIDEKIKFVEEAFIIRQETCHQRIAETPALLHLRRSPKPPTRPQLAPAKAARPSSQVLRLRRLLGPRLVVSVGKEETELRVSNGAEQQDASPEDLECVQQIQRVLELLTKNRDMLFGESAY